MLKKEKIKIIAATIFLLITLSTFVLANAGSHETQDSYYQFDVYFARNVEIEKLVINGAINFYDYGFDKKIFIVSPDNEILTTTAFGYEKPSLDDVRFLSDKNAIIDFFADNEIIDVEMYEIIYVIRSLMVIFYMPKPLMSVISSRYFLEKILMEYFKTKKYILVKNLEN